ncbi:hypothetical protein V6N12_038858 [Hibiscus sabdariffa]|uniref:RNase H type-1 domain-containing protein n=1 Tax=Hibiscus sabdariffa TaxID=183260 RepID=A0ABR2DYX6_9ROSI
MREFLPEVVLDHLAATPPPLPHLGEDVLGWRWDAKREFRVSSAYSVLMQDGARIRNSKWTRIWSLKVPQRVKVFLWITAHQRLLTNVERVRRHIASSDMCGLCLSEPEDIDHVLRRCEKAKDLWRNVLGREVAASLDSLPFEEWLHGNISCRLPEIIDRADWDMEFAIYVWLLWKLRCSLVLDLNFVERGSVWDRGRRLFLECKAINTAAVRGPAMELNTETRWVSPPRGWIKCRCSVLMAELWAMYDGLRHAWEAGFRNIEIESDNKEVVNICNGTSSALKVSVLVSHIVELLKREWRINVKHVSRSCNAVADLLAKLGQQGSMQGFRFATPPAAVAFAVEADRCQGRDDSVTAVVDIDGSVTAVVD